jgi:thioesterase domain-containing protein
MPVMKLTIMKKTNSGSATVNRDYAGELQAFLYAHLPLARSAGLKVDHYVDGVLQLSAPLSLNDNDKGTAFGGSLYNATVMTGWGLTSIIAKEFECSGDLVIAKADIDYLRPLQEQIIARAERPSSEMIERFRESYAKRGKASLNQIVTVEDSKGQLCARFHGKYAIIANGQ